MIIIHILHLLPTVQKEPPVPVLPILKVRINGLSKYDPGPFYLHSRIEVRKEP